MKKLKVGILGCGVIAETHAWAIEENEGAVLTALCDIDQSRMDKLNKGRDCLLFNEWKDMFQSPEVDAVAICLPHYLHEPAVLDALEAGKHVICEKPLAVSLNQLEEMKKAAASSEEKGIYSFGIFQHRFSPLIQEIGKILNEQALGPIERGYITFRCTRDSSYYGSESWRGRWMEEGGGTLINQGIHTLDVLHYLIGLPEGAEFKLYREKLSSIEVEDRGAGILHYPASRVESGAISIEFENDLKTDWEPVICLRGSLGTIILKGSEDFECSIPSLNERLNAATGTEEQQAPGKACYGSLHSENYRDIIHSISERSRGLSHEPVVSLYSLADTTETVLAIYQSHFQQKRITLPLKTWAEPYTLTFTGDTNG